MGKSFKKAFSLIELMVVLAVFVALCALVAPLFIKSPDYMLNSELNKLVIGFLYVQQKAMASGQTQKITFDVSQNAYSYIGLGGKTCINKLSDPINIGFIDTVKGPPASPNQIISQAVTFQSNSQENWGVSCAICLPDGKMSPGTVYLTDKHKKFMGAVTCSVSPVACVRKYRWGTGKWEIMGLE
ncbi:MAG: type II secretion system protein [bacterium]